MTIPLQGQGSFAVNVEHTRHGHHKITMTKNEVVFVDPKNGPVTEPTVLPALEGTLDPGIDDVPNVTPDMTFGPNTDSITIEVELDDPSLNTGRPTDRFIWERRFRFSGPGTQEP